MTKDNRRSTIAISANSRIRTQVNYGFVFSSDIHKWIRGTCKFINRPDYDKMFSK